MRTALAAATALALCAVPATAQTLGTGLSALQIGVACAPPPVLSMDEADAIRVIAGQDSEAKQLLGDQDKLVLSGGAARGLAVGQEYFLRRLVVDPNVYGVHAYPTNTIGWITITAVNDATAIASVEKTCGPIAAGDFLQPFVRPNPPPGVEIAQKYGQLDFGALGRVLFGSDEHHNLTVGNYVLIDQGSAQGVTPGTHFALYRDPGAKAVRNPNAKSVPLVAVGEAGVVSVGPTMSLVRVNESRTEVRTGDYVVPKR